MDKGFTLVELLVAVGMFSLLMTMLVSALLTMVHTNRQGQALSLVTSNLHFALDSMTRNIRIGYDYACAVTPPNCPGGASSFGFRSSNDLDGVPGGDDVVYEFYDNAGHGEIRRQLNGGSWITLTGSDIDIDTDVSKFYVTGASAYPDTYQPKVLVVIKATADVFGQTTAFNLQTTAVQRIIDN